jgi:Flp pilus assembly protein TadD
LPSGTSPRLAWGRLEWFLAALLAVATLLTFSQVLWCGFVDYDDPYYVTQNSHLQAGLNRADVSWAFSTLHHGNWHPLVWLSLMLDAQVYGTNHPTGFHLTNLLWHVGSVLLLFAALRRLTGETWPSALAAALFAIHPLNVEPVAWVSERKGILSTFFWVLALWAYARYTERPSLGRYLCVALSLVLGLMAKPMLITLPFVLLLLDFWPLNRLKAPPPETPENDNIRPQARRWRRLGLLLLEKLPLLAVVVGFSVLAVIAQGHGDALHSEEFSTATRLKNAALSYVWYLRQAVFPNGLAAFYPHPGDSVPLWQAVSAVLLLLAFTGVALGLVRRAPYLAVGWLWFLGTLVPVLGLVQVGMHARADRYAYVPLIGLFLLASWGITDLAKRWRRVQLVAAVVAVALICFMTASWAQTLVWRNSQALWEHDLQVAGENCTAHSNLGIWFDSRAEPEKALRHYRAAVRLSANDPRARFNLAMALLSRNAVEEATHHLEIAVRLNPGMASAHGSLGHALMRQGRLKEAVAHGQEAIRLDPTSAQAHQDLGLALLLHGQPRKGIVHVREAARLDPTSPSRHNILGAVLINRGECREAIQHLTEAVRLDPGSHPGHANLGLAYQVREEWAESAVSFRRAVALRRGESRYHRGLALSLQRVGQPDEARTEYRVSLDLDPHWPATTLREAWRMASSSDPALRNGSLAVLLAEQVLAVSEDRGPEPLDVLAAARAEAGRYTDAAKAAREALARARAADRRELAQAIERRLRLYEHGQPFRAREPAP